MEKKIYTRILSVFTAVLFAVLSVSPVFAAESEAVQKNALLEEYNGALEKNISAEEAEQTEPEYAADDKVRVFIVFNGNSVADAGYDLSGFMENSMAQGYSKWLSFWHGTVLSSIAKVLGEKISTRYSFTLLANAVSATVAYGDLDSIRSVTGVKAVYLVPVYEAEETEEGTDNELCTVTSGEMVGSHTVWDNGYTGAGMRIAIVDTGLDTDHPSFDEGAYLYSLEKTAEEAGKDISEYDLLEEDEIASVFSKLHVASSLSGVTAADLYRTSKVAFAFNYASKNLDVDHDDGVGDHGTHVSGIAAANKYVPQEDGSYDVQEDGVAGIAPDAQLLVMKVASPDGIYTDDYFAAIEDAMLLGADSINLSIGSSYAGFSSSSNEWIAGVMDELADSDTVLCVSAGNESYWSSNSSYGYNLTSDVSADTMGQPSSYTNSLSIASCMNSGYTGPVFHFASGEVLYKDGVDGVNFPFSILDIWGTGTGYGYVFLDGTGMESDYEGIDVTDKIVIVRRTTESGHAAEQHLNAENAGAAGIILYDYQYSIYVPAFDLSASTANIPFASISLADAEAIRACSVEAEGGKYFVGTFTIRNEIKTIDNFEFGYQMSPFSSWGVTGSLELKPEITAPGSYIYSTLDNGTYGNMSGTSMSSPCVAGMTALVMQYIEENGLEEKTGLSKRVLAQSLLMSTASPLTEEDGEEYSPRVQGAGLASVLAATTSPAYILVGNKSGNDGKVKVSLGDDPDRTGCYSFGFDVYSLGEISYYLADASVLTESVIEKNGQKFIGNSSYALDPSVSITADQMILLYDINSDGKVSAEDAAALLESAFADYVSANRNLFDFNDDGVIDASDAAVLKANISGDATGLDLTAQLVVVSGTTHVTVTIDLTEEDRDYLDSSFENGMYVEGFVSLDGEISLSVPFLAFYGNWTDSSMFDSYDYLDAKNNGTEYTTYTGVEVTNALVYQHADRAELYYYSGNLYGDDTSYLADRNAMSSVSGDSIYEFNFTLIRNAYEVSVTVTDTATGEIYFSKSQSWSIAAFYSSGWLLNSADFLMDWNCTDADGNPLPEGTSVMITLTALPEYYEDETKTPGEGASISIPMTIDNTAPAAELLSLDRGTNTAVFEISDNRYIAAVEVYDADMNYLYTYSPNQTEKGISTEVELTLEEGISYVSVIDYAGNTKNYKISTWAKNTVTTLLDIAKITPVVYTGTAQRPAVTVSYNGTVLTEYKDYIVTYSDNVDAGVADVTVIGLGAYLGRTGTAQFEILPVTVSSGNTEMRLYTLPLGSYGTYIYGRLEVDGKMISNDGLTFVVTDENGNAVADNKVTEEGTYLLFVQCTGNYDGTLYTTFTVQEITFSLFGFYETSFLVLGSGSEE